MTNDTEETINVSVHDDDISEAEEVFIAYTDYMESLNDSCAAIIYILDNDCEYSNM